MDRGVKQPKGVAVTGTRTEQDRGKAIPVILGTWYLVLGTLAPLQGTRYLPVSTGIQPFFMHAVKTIVGMSSFLGPAAHGFVVIRSTLVPFCRVIAIIAEWRHCR